MLALATALCWPRPAEAQDALSASDRIDNDDGSWSRVRDDGVEVGDTMETNGVTWQCEGQIHLSDPPVPPAAHLVEVEAGYRDRFVAYTCTNADWGTIHYWRTDADDRVRQTSLSTRQQAGALIIASYADGATGLCGGVWLDSDSLLTAAHCIWDSGIDEVMGKTDIDVCTRGNAYSGAHCTSGGVANRIISPDYHYPTNPVNDYAIITIRPNAVIEASHTSMYLSSASDSVVTAIPMHNIAYPLHSPPTESCADNTASPISSLFGWGIALSHQTGDISAPLFSSNFHFAMDGGEGHSGSPVYYCGDSWCDTGDPAYVVSIWSGAYYIPGLFGTFRGPKVRNFRTWAISQM